jgi:cytochrome c553
MKMKVTRAVIITSGLLAVMGLFCPSSIWAADADAGGAVFAKKCRTCHGKEGQGNPGMAKVLKVEIKHLGSAEIQGKTDDELAKTITEGVGKMKPAKGLSADDVTNIIAFVRTIKE